MKRNCESSDWRHQTDMAQVYKIITGKDMVNREVWFQKVDGAEWLTSSAADPLNLRHQATSGGEKELFLKQNCWRLEQNTKWSEECKNSGHLQRWLCQTQNWTGGKHGLKKRRKQDGEVQTTPSADTCWEALPGSLRVNLTTTTTRQYSNNEKAFNTVDINRIVLNSAKYGITYYFKLFI